MTDFEYYGLFLDEETKTILANKIVSLNSIMSKVFYDAIKKYNITKYYLGHCTLLHKSQAKDFQYLIPKLEWMVGNTYVMKITDIGYSDKAIAFKVHLGILSHRCVNKTPHITIATFNGGTEEDSNYITK